MTNKNNCDEVGTETAIRAMETPATETASPAAVLASRAEILRLSEREELPN
jgi:hypothetical protein